MTGHRLALALAALLIAPTLSALAAPADHPPELPSAEQARRAIDHSPEVRAAIASREATLAERRQLAAGPQEWIGRSDYQRRRVSASGTSQDYREWELALERQLRSPAKAQLDRRLGDERAAEGDVALADARHEASRQLLQLWYGWLREHAIAQTLRSQATLVGREATTVGRREQLGDASRLERLQGQGALAQAEAAARLAEERSRRAETMLRNRFPGIPIAPRPSLPDPSMPGADDLAALAQVAIEEDHGLRLARVTAERARLESLRTLAGRRPDLTAGVRYRSELGGADRIVGVYVSIPFPGEARRAASDAALARADESAERVSATLLQLNAEVRSLEQLVSSGQGRWQVAERGAELQAQAADRVAVSHRLGEAGFTEVLLARRQALEAMLAANSARVDALENRARLLLDAHVLWDFDAMTDPGN